MDFVAGTLLIERNVAVLERGRTAVKETKTEKARRIALDPFAVKLLKRHRAMMNERAQDVDVVLSEDGPIFTYDLERPISPDMVTHYVRNLGRRLGLDVHLHSLRHFAATEMIGSGHDVRTVAGRLGHTDATTTLRVYAHVLPQRDRDAAAALGSALSV